MCWSVSKQGTFHHLLDHAVPYPKLLCHVPDCHVSIISLMSSSISFE